jgi:hypothetical protein
MRDNKHLFLNMQLKALIKYINNLTKRGLPPINAICHGTTLYEKCKKRLPHKGIEFEF